MGKIKDLPMSDRPREKALTEGIDKLSDSEYNTYYSIIADKAIGYRKLRQELMSIDVKSYSDELKKEYHAHIYEVLNDLNKVIEKYKHYFKI